MTSKLIDRIRSSQLTKNQKIIADYFVKNLTDICTMTSLEIAHEVGVSDASVIRFARAIGYEGFADLKEDFYNMISSNSSGELSKLSLSERIDISTTKYQSKDIKDSFTRIMYDNIGSTIEMNKAELYDQIIDGLTNSKRKFIIGLRGGKGAAVQMSRLLRYLVDDVIEISSDDSDAIGLLQCATQEDIVVFFSFARYYKIDVSLISLAKQKGAMICVISDQIITPVTEHADIVLVTETESMSFFNSALGSAAIVEYLLTMLCWKEKDKFQSRLEERDAYLAEFRL